jgi:glycosyltransferase involved in cell wall biosynthesis
MLGVRIGIMLRHYDQHGGGVKVYTRQLLDALLANSGSHEFVFLFNSPHLIGTYRNYLQVQEISVQGKSVLWWDQVGVPWAVRKYGINMLFNPKYSIPLAVHCPTAWVCHGLDWYVMPQASRWIDRLSHRYLVPRYAAKASAIIAVSEITRQHVMQFLKVPADRVHTVYSGVSSAYRKRWDEARLRTVRERYQLPARFFLYSGAVYPPKNFTRLVQAYAKVGPSSGISLVIAGGENRFLSEHELQEPARLGLGDWVKWCGWIDTQTLPAFYQMAEALLLPSLFESLGLPILEAMASGCPVVTSDRYGTKEIAANAAVLVNPESVDAIEHGMRSVLDDPALRARLIQAGMQRSMTFTWQRCAAQVLEVLTACV